MALENPAIKQNTRHRLKAIIRDVEAVAIGVGWLALLALLSHGGAFMIQAFSPAPVDVDLPQPAPDYDQVMMTDSVIVLGCCAAIVVIAELLRRRQRGAREPA